MPVIGNCRCSNLNLRIIGFVEIQIDGTDQFVTDSGGNKYIHGAKQICDSRITNGSISLSGNDFGVKEARLAQ